MAKAKTKWVSLIPGDPTPFRRCIRDEKGDVARKLEFLADQPLELTDEEFAVVQGDIGRTLCVCEPSKDSPDRFRVDWNGTDKVHEDVHGVVLPRQSKPVNVGAGQQPKVDPVEPADPEADVELSDELIEALEKNVVEHGEWVLDPDAIKEKVAAGFDLTSLTDIGKARAADLKKALGIN
jgi:hypothetical protein